MINSLPIETHEDERRVLIEWIKDYSVRNCKVLMMKEDGVVGNHYHKEKDEIFFLLTGSGSVTLEGDTHEIREGDVVYAGRGIKHSFSLSKGSVLLEAGTKPYDKDDDYR